MLSLSFDRNATVDVRNMDPPQAWGNVDPYHNTMYLISQVTLDIIHDRTRQVDPRDLVARIYARLDELEGIISEADEYLQDAQHCSNSQQHIEHHALRMHYSYVISELCRPAIHQMSGSSEVTRLFRRKCVDSLVVTLDGYLELNNFSSFARHTWHAAYRGLSSALLLGILGEHLHNAQARVLIIRVISMMDDIDTDEEEADVCPLFIRAVKALKQLHVGVPLRSAQATEAPSVDRRADEHMDIDETTGNPTRQTRSRDISSPHSDLNTILWGKGYGNDG
jgi:hypothetical protein